MWRNVALSVGWQALMAQSTHPTWSFAASLKEIDVMIWWNKLYITLSCTEDQNCHLMVKNKQLEWYYTEAKRGKMLDWLNWSDT